MVSRYAVSSNEEIWVRVCHRFFLDHGFYDWYSVSQEDALREMLKYSNGTANPDDIRRRIAALYESVGVK